MAETHPSFCRMCHSACPILVDVEDGVAVKVSGDPSSEIYHGYTCIKGRALPEMHVHPDRLLHSLARQPDGTFAPIASEQAMDEIAAQLTRIVDEHGPLAVALYSGTFGLANALTATDDQRVPRGARQPARVGRHVDRPARQDHRAGSHGRLDGPAPGSGHRRRVHDHRLEPVDLDRGRTCPRPIRGSGCTTPSDAGSS